ncbi:MAG: ATP-binding protein [Thermomicrobiaceae bacterium]
MTGIRAKLLLSYLLVIATGIAGLVMGMQLLGPSLFDRMLDQHATHHPDMMGTGMTEPMRELTVDAFRDALFDAVAISTVIATIVALMVSFFVSNRITAPLRQLALGSQRIAAGDYRARVHNAEHDEIGELANTFNRMASALEDTEQRRVQLIGDVAHELRTPLSTLHGNLEGLGDGVVEPSAELWSQLHQETTRLSRIVDDLQELSRVESGQLPLAIKATEPGKLIETAVTGLRSQIAEKGVSVQLELPDNLPVVAVDPGRTIQILNNLLGNALRYTPPGGSVTVSAQPESTIVRVRIEDTGIGIPAAHLSQIFNRFYRVDGARSRAHGGSGIGLSISRALVEAQDGEIGAESSGADQGSTFWFTMPVATGR